MSYPFGNPNPANANKSKNQSATYKNFARNFALSPSDMGKTITVNTHNGYNLVLPDARQIRGQRFITIKNVATTNLLITNNSGVGIKTVTPNSSVVLACTDISSESGVWSALAGTNLSALYVGSQINVDAAKSSFDYECICALSATKAIAFYKDAQVGSATYTMGFASLLTISGTGITVESTIQVTTNATNHTAICAMDATHAVIMYAGGSSYATMRVLTVSGISISASAETTAYAGTSAYCSLCPLDSTHFAIAYTGLYNYVYVNIVTTNGSAITGLGAAVTAVSSGVTDSIGLCTLDSTHAILLTNTSSTPQNINASVLTFSGGTTVAVGTQYPVYNNATAGADTAPSISALDSTHAVVFYRGSHTNYGYANVLTVSGGNTISVGSISNAIQGGAGAGVYRCKIAAININTAICLYESGGDSKNYAQILNISGATISLSTTYGLSVSGGTAGYSSIAVLPSENKAIAFYRGASSYAYANVLTYTP